MATQNVKFFRETALPATFEPGGVYFVSPDPSSGYVEIYTASNDGSAVRRVVRPQDVQDMITAALGANQNTVVVDDIAARDALAPTAVKFAYVKDATADTSVNSGAALYLFDPAAAAWSKVAEYDNMDVALTWDALQNKPTSTVSAIDDAVTKAHTHTNKTQLDKVGEDANGNMTYGGSPVTTAWASTNW